MIMYDYQTLWLLAGGDSNLILKYFSILANKRQGWEHLVGDNFIVNPNIILNNPDSQSSVRLAEYLGLCSLRPFSRYKLYRDVHIPLELVPEYIPKDVVTSCPWVDLIGENLVFTAE